MLMQRIPDHSGFEVSIQFVSHQPSVSTYIGACGRRTICRRTSRLWSSRPPTKREAVLQLSQPKRQLSAGPQLQRLSESALPPPAHPAAATAHHSGKRPQGCADTAYCGGLPLMAVQKRQISALDGGPCHTGKQVYRKAPQSTSRAVYRIESVRSVKRVVLNS